MNDPAGKYLLLWKGAQSGPYRLDEIRSKLTAGDISRMHQIHAEGSWQVLDEFLLKLRAEEMEARRKEARRREHSEADRRRLAIPGGRSQPDGGSGGKERGSENASGESSGLAVESRRKRSSRFSREAERDDSDDSYEDSEDAGRTSGLGIAAFVVAIFSFVITVAAGVALSGQISAPALAICNLVPYVDIVAWIVALTFGHMALRQTGEDETLRGRHLAIAALVITYFLVVVGLTVVFLMFISHQKTP